SDKRERQKENRRARLEAEAEAYKRSQRNRRLVALLIAAFVLGLVILVVNVFGNDDKNDQASSTTSTAPATTAATGSSVPGTTVAPRPFYGPAKRPPTDGVDNPVLTFDDKPQQCIDPSKQYTAVFDTSEGEIKVALDTTKTPATANNFVTLARYGYYDGTKI